jgi:hypothetical protein
VSKLLIISWHLLNIQHCKYEAVYVVVRKFYKEVCEYEAYTVEEIPLQAWTALRVPES